MVARCAISFDELCAQLPARLQQAQAKCREGASSFAVVGFSHDLGRLIVCAFDSDDSFEPHLLTRWCFPHVPEIERADPASFFAPIDIARAQAALLPRAGLLTVARLDGAGEIRTRVVHCLSTDQAITGPPRLGALAAKAEAA